MNRRSFIENTIAATALSTSLNTIAAPSAERPNILWLTCEDNNINWIGCYGNPHANTPNIDKMAREGFQYTHAFANAPVCAPSRCTWITGINAVSMGTHPMRSRHKIPDFIKYYPEYLGNAGYYTGNFLKRDYNVGGRDEYEVNVWTNGTTMDWDALKNRQPFFQVINAESSHESRAFGEVDNTEHDPKNTVLRKYHPDLPVIRQNYAHYHDAIKKMDDEIGASLAKLEELGLADNTIVIHNSDHGGVMARSKRYIFGSGIHCPLIIRIPEKFKHLWPAEKPGMKIDRIVSYVDMTPTWLSLAGAKIPNHMQGDIFLGPDTAPEKEFHIAFRGRMDERCENARAVCDKQYLYIRNYMPYVPWMQHLNYLWNMKATQAWAEHVKAGKASEVESRFFKSKGYSEELYDMHADPDNVVNLINNPEHAQRISRMRQGLRLWQEKIHDCGLLPESELIKRAKDNSITIYELVRDPKLYNLPALLAAADLALEQNPDNLPKLTAMLNDPECGIRYWAVTGCFLLGKQATSARAEMQRLLEDSSHEVRALAAWHLYKLGDKEICLSTMNDLLKQHSYASLKVLNMVDWIGDDAKGLMPTVLAMDCSKTHPEYSPEIGYESRMQKKLATKYGLKVPRRKKK